MKISGLGSGSERLHLEDLERGHRAYETEYIHLSQVRALQPLIASCYCPSFFSPAYQVHVAKTSEFMSKPCFPMTELQVLYSPLCEIHD